MVLRTLENRSPLQRPACFYVTIFEQFQYFNFKTNSLENENLFQKTEKVEGTKIENAPFPYETAMSEADIKTNRMVRTKWTYHKKRSFASNHFIFSIILFQFKNLLQRADLIYQRPKCPYSYFL